MLTAVEHIGEVGVGITSPQFFRAHDGNIYVVKLQNNRLGLKVLVNEFLAARFGQILELRFPPSDIIEISDEIIRNSPQLAEQNVTPGRHFASRYLDRAEYLGKHNLSKASNIPETAGIMLFDHLFQNSDRAYNRKNLLLRQESNENIIYAIDNSHLHRSGKWTIKGLNRLGTRKRIFYRYTYGLLLKDFLCPKDFSPYIEKIKLINEKLVENIVEEIPAEWLPDKDEQQALIQYIKLRLSLVDEIWRKLCRQIPQERGGRRLLIRKITMPEAAL